MNAFFGVIGVFAVIVLATMATIIAGGFIRGFILRKKLQKEMKNQILKKGDQENGSGTDRIN